MRQHVLLGIAVLLFWAGGVCVAAPPGASADPKLLEPAPADPLPRPTADLQNSLNRALKKLQLERAVDEGRLAVSLVDVSDPARPRYAGVNDRKMLYAASLPKIAVLLAAFEKVKEGLLAYTSDVKEMLTRMIRFSSNPDASLAIQTVSFPYIASVLTTPQYRFYDPAQNGGLWVGKAYGGPNDQWQRDPLHNLSHGATSRQVARFFFLLDRGSLVSPAYSAEMKEILSDPGIHHKFVKGLETKPGARIYRKSGTWRNWHSDAALVEREGKRYIAVALMEDRKGGEVLERLIVELDDIICGPAPESAAP